MRFVLVVNGIISVLIKLDLGLSCITQKLIKTNLLVFIVVLVLFGHVDFGLLHGGDCVIFSFFSEIWLFTLRQVGAMRIASLI